MTSGPSEEEQKGNDPNDLCQMLTHEYLTRNGPAMCPSMRNGEKARVIAGIETGGNPGFLRFQPASEIVSTVIEA